ncbi:zinc-ribbon and DUF3426 domain-containing protein [Kangiella sp. TOML190]|uniref:zinc-ribbon and DUF3426 domain-containing protein n=1 Tax=Kangiella sp. TOML190 TaxID=2931351 RepID=UPI00203EDDAF|nr:zinc-ribbon and DUF3426 domain-containing protein [Kangiella sp. TOML190]
MSETFLTHCPHCKSVFKLRKEHLEMAEGHVRCGSCHSLFLATDSLVSMEQESQKTAMAEDVEQASEKLVEKAFDDLVDAPELTIEPAKPKPEARPIPWKGLFYGLSSVILLSCAFWYLYLWPNRMALSQDKAWRPLLQASCSIFGCQVPSLQRIELFVVSAIEVSPKVKGQQEVSMLLKNTADFAQPFPKVKVVLSDIKGGQFTTPVFTPAQYLPEVNHNTLIEPNQTVQIGFSFLSDNKSYSGYQVQLVN